MEPNVPAVEEAAEMCIRDSIPSAAQSKPEKLFPPLPKALPGLFTKPIHADDFSPVSYTHLDMAEDPLPELTEEEMFGNTPSETDDQSACLLYTSRCV